jgi:glyoxylase-like metal-dependent hydrolase (beta-lactamase superfamily II)
MANDVHVLDTKHLGMGNAVGVFLILDSNEFSLIETGPGSTLPVIKKAIADLGFDLGDLAHVLVTHIHLDHAGGAGELARETGAKVYVHERGGPHLIDPSKLLSSAQRIYGDQMETLWGTIIPIPESQVTTLQGGEDLELSHHQIKVIHTPGHASHHVSYLLDEDLLFTGDSAGICFEGSSVIRPALPPPEVDLEVWKQSIDAMLAAKPKRLMLTHFGEVKDAEGHLNKVLVRNQIWADEVLTGLRQNEDVPTLTKRISHLAVQELLADGASAEVIRKHQMTSNAEMTVMGLSRYWQKFHPEKLSATV